jgi:hypothetical protein
MARMVYMPGVFAFLPHRVPGMASVGVHIVMALGGRYMTLMIWMCICQGMFLMSHFGMVMMVVFCFCI